MIASVMLKIIITNEHIFSSYGNRAHIHIVTFEGYNIGLDSVSQMQ